MRITKEEPVTTGPIENGPARYARLIRNAEKARAERIGMPMLALDTAETDAQLDTAAGEFITQVTLADEEYRRRIEHARRHLSEGA
jgi:hypothetical protein